MNRKSKLLSSVLLVLALLIGLGATSVLAVTTFVPDVWDLDTADWVNGLAEGYTEGEVVPIRAQITDADGTNVVFSVCLDMTVSSNGAYGFSDLEPWDTDYTPSVTPPIIANLGSVVGDGFQIENGTINSATFAGLSDGGASFRCPEDYLEWKVDLTLPTDADGSDETAVLVYGAKLAKPGDTTANGDTVPLGAGASAVNGTFQVRLENGGAETINFKGPDVAPAEGGRIVIIKDATPEDDTEFPFTIDGLGGLITGDFTLQDPSDNTASFSSLTAGDYTVTEAVPEGWDLNDIVCESENDDSTATPNLAENQVDIDLEDGDTVTCTFTNAALPATIKIVKDATPADDTMFPFEFTGPNIVGPLPFALRDPTEPSFTFSSLYPGNYDVTEFLPAGWTLGDIVCDSANANSTSTPDFDKNSVDIDLAAGDTVTCTFYNDKLGTITIIKDAVPDSPQDFSFNFYGYDPFELLEQFSLDDDADSTLSNTKVIQVQPGRKYGVSEAAPPAGWTLESIECTSSDTSRIFPGNSYDPNNGGTGKAFDNVKPGEEITCTFTNVLAPGSIKIIKYAEPDDDTEFPFTIVGFTGSNVNDQFTLQDPSGNTITYSSLIPGNYDVTELVPAGWDLDNIECDSENDTSTATTDVDNNTVDIDLASADTVTCTFYNSQVTSFCPADDPNVGFSLTRVTGIGMGSPTKAVRQRQLTVPDVDDVESIYGQLAAIDIGTMRFARFLYQTTTLVKIDDPTSPAFRKWAVDWWGSELDVLSPLKGRFGIGTGAARAPRAFVLWPTYKAEEEYADVFQTFDSSATNHVYWGPGWVAEQTHEIAIPVTQADGAEITVKVALIDNQPDSRPVVLTVTPLPNGTPVELVMFGPYVPGLGGFKVQTLNLEEVFLQGVPAGTSAIQLKLLSPGPFDQRYNTGPLGGDSVAMIGAAASYPCAIENGPDPVSR